jgi:hypothetical protein
MNNYRSYLQLTILLGSLLSAASVFGATPVFMTLDEYGAGAPLSPPGAPGTQQFTSLLLPPPFPAGYTIATDQVSHMTTLCYILQDNVQTAGDLYLTEPNFGVISDIIRFDGQGRVFFFSLKEPGQTSFSLADVDTLPGLSGNILGQVEVPSDEHNVGNLFNPTLSTQPGFDPLYGGSLAYNIISDVPEPGIGTFAGLCAMALVFGRKKSR